MTRDEDWVKLAMTDDSLVAALLSRLHRPGKPPPPALRLDWSVRQRRSRAPARHRHDDDVKARRRRKKKKERAEPRRASPTTPLSWSGATSVSGGSEESSKPSGLPGGAAARSKVSLWKSETTISKRPRKKKTLAELKEEEILLFKERKKLRREIETMRLNIQKQRAANESFRRFKLDFESRQKPEAVAEHSPVSPTTQNLNPLKRTCALSASCKAKEVETRESGFPLPDLNLPAEAGLESHAALYGIAS